MVGKLKRKRQTKFKVDMMVLINMAFENRQKNEKRTAMNRRVADPH
jgi:hypothetical protein